MMYSHIGNDIIINSNKIIGIFDIDKTTVFKVNRKYLSNKEKKGIIKYVGADLPKSFILCGNDENDDEVVYVSSLNTSTILKRTESLCEI